MCNQLDQVDVTTTVVTIYVKNAIDFSDIKQNPVRLLDEEKKLFGSKFSGSKGHGDREYTFI